MCMNARNAIGASRTGISCAGGSIVIVTTSVEERFAHISVCDSGCAQLTCPNPALQPRR